MALPTLIAAKEGDVNAKYRQVVNVSRANAKVSLTIRDNGTGNLYTLAQAVGTKVVMRDDQQGGTEVLTRLPSVPEHIDLEAYAFPTANIETIKKGQQVVTRDPVTGTTEIQTIARTFKHTAYEIIQLDLADKTTGKCVESIRGTPEHPFFTPNGMIAMGKLKPGMEVSTRDNDELLVVKAVKREQQPEGIPVYNFEVADDHTYFVGKTHGGAWVHNVCFKISTIADDWIGKGFHMKINGVEIAMRPGNGGSIVFKPVFSSTPANEVSVVLRNARSALSDPANRQLYYREAMRARDFLRLHIDPRAAGVSGEMKFLMNALEKMGL